MPARVTIGIVSVLININTNNQVVKQISPVSYSTSMNSFLIGSLMFTVFALIEYAILNWAGTTYAKMRSKINETLT